MTVDGETPTSFSWRRYIDRLISERGSLAQVALQLAERRDFAEDTESVERGLRRLRDKAGAGGVWGQRLLGVFGIPRDIEDRVRWMGHYHRPFTDLPVSICEALIESWDRPPVSESTARVWVLLGRASVALRRKSAATALLSQARLLAARAPVEARVELALVEAFAADRDDHATIAQRLDEAEAGLRGVAGEDAACLYARLVDQRAYRFNRPRGGEPDHRAALELYEQIPADGPLFARCRRENGLGWSKLSLGGRQAAITHAQSSLQAAGDSGSLRLRAMALNLLAAAEATEAAKDARQRARAIAQRLEDDALMARFG